MADVAARARVRVNFEPTDLRTHVAVIAGVAVVRVPLQSAVFLVLHGRDHCGDNT